MCLTGSCAADVKGRKNMMKKQVSPCKTCTRVKNPGECENKCYGVWRNWFLRQWNLINGYYQKCSKEENV